MQLSSKHKTSSLCWINVGPASKEVDQHWSNKGAMSCFCWVVSSLASISPNQQTPYRKTRLILIYVLWLGHVEAMRDWLGMILLSPTLLLRANTDINYSSKSCCGSVHITTSTGGYVNIILLMFFLTDILFVAWRRIFLPGSIWMTLH